MKLRAFISYAETENGGAAEELQKTLLPTFLDRVDPQLHIVREIPRLCRSREHETENQTHSNNATHG